MYKDLEREKETRRYSNQSRDLGQNSSTTLTANGLNGCQHRNFVAGLGIVWPRSCSDLAGLVASEHWDRPVHQNEDRHVGSRKNCRFRPLRPLIADGNARGIRFSCLS